jgi:hypothetical protein
MRFVQHPAIRPHKCAVLPVMGSHNSRGFIDTGQDMRDPDSHVYISVEALELMATQYGWQPSAATAPLKAKIEALEKQISDLKAEVAEAEKFAQAAEYTLGKFGTKVQKKPGRKVAA